MIISFSHLNLIDLGNSNHSFARKLINRSGNGGYYLIFDSSFDDIYPANTQSSKQDVIDAFCEWNQITEAELEIVSSCPTGGICFKVEYSNINSGGTSTVLAAGISQASQFSGCAGEAVVSLINLVFNDQIIDWRPSAQAGPFDPYVIKTTTYHEVGHLLQLGHVYNNNSLMYPDYSSNFTIDTDAAAGGTHVTNISAITNCTNKLLKGIIGSCTTPTVEENNNNFLKIMPNPFRDDLTLRIEENFYSGVLKIFDLSGTLLRHEQVNSNNHYVSTAGWTSGIYFLSFQCEAFSAQLKTIKL